MAQAGGMSATWRVWAVHLVRVAVIAIVLGGWEALAHSGLLFRDVVPPVMRIAEALKGLLMRPDFYSDLAVTASEVGTGVAIGGAAGLVTGLLLGGSRFASRAFEPYVYYLAPTPKIIFFPVLIMLFGVGIGSKIAIAALSCFFPVALSVATGMREVDRVLIRVGRSFRATTLQMVTKIYVPAMRAPIINGVRLGFGVAVIGTLLAETKLSNQGLGFQVIQAYTFFNMPQMYALLIVIFTLAIGANSLLARLAGAQPGSGR